MISTKTNHLANQKSPYLLQHVHHPIDWYPWGKEAFEKAQKENKPLFISIGYSACHWCHVMSRESFENPAIADLLNKHFVAVKVDREERPDVDNIYMNACLAMNGQGGWPLTVIATPDQKPFFTATYMPPKTEMGRMGLFELLTNVADKWKKNGQRLWAYGQEFCEFLERISRFQKDVQSQGKELFEKSFSFFEKNFDRVYGGFGQAPKFPCPHDLMFLMRYKYFEKNEKAMKMVEKTLESMYRGGIYDHIGSGFSRYSTDRMWHIPHFEKMLYDNALLSMAYLEAYQITGKQLYQRIAENILEFVIREMTSESGAFGTALDADAEEEEGKFYAFEYQEITKLLGEADGKLFNEHFNILMEGKFDGKNIPNLIGNKTIESDEKLNSLIQAVYHYRKKRYELKRDEKALTSLNCLMICAFLKAYMVMKRQAYLILAQKGLDFVEKNLIDEESNIYVSYFEGRTDIPGGIDDYAYYCMALVNMYEATFKPDYLKKAILFVNKTIENFADEQNGGFFMNDKRAHKLIYRPKEVFDGAMPCGNSVMGYVLNKMSRLTGKSEIMDAARKHNEFLNKVATENPGRVSFALMSLMQEYYPSKEIIAVAQNEEKLISIKDKQQEFSPETTFIVKFTETEDYNDYSDFLWEYEMKNNNTTYYICENKKCTVQNKL